MQKFIQLCMFALQNLMKKHLESAKSFMAPSSAKDHARRLAQFCSCEWCDSLLCFKGILKRTGSVFILKTKKGICASFSPYIVFYIYISSRKGL